MSAEKWTRGGRCEAGLPILGQDGQIDRLPACDKRARWIVDGVLLCGGCKRKLEAKVLT